MDIFPINEYPPPERQRTTFDPWQIYKERTAEDAERVRQEVRRIEERRIAAAQAAVDADPYEAIRARLRQRDAERQAEAEARAEAERQAAAQAQAEEAQRFTVPATEWSGKMRGFEDALRDLSNKTLAATNPDELDQLEHRLRDIESYIEEYKSMVRRYQERIKQKKEQKQETETKIQELRNRDTNPLTVADEDLASLCTYLSSLQGVLGIRVLANGDVTIQVRTAIRNNANELFDMGDFEITLSGEGYGSVYGDYSNVAQALDIQCVRLPRKTYDNWEAKAYPDFRLHHHRGTVEKRRDGLYRIRGGEFCVGYHRAQAVADHLNKGEFKQALNLVIASLNDTQHKNDLRRYGRFIPDEHEAAFFAGT